MVAEQRLEIGAKLAVGCARFVQKLAPLFLF